jgi:hypothetical protein
MTGFSKKQYESQLLWTMLLYSAFMLFAWPLLRTVDRFPLKLLLALAPMMPLAYLIVLIARRIRASDEFEQRTHLVALGVAAAVTSALGLIGGFLSIAGVVQLDGSVLIWVFPVIMWSYSIARWSVLRRYGVGVWCADDASVWFYLRFALLGIVILAIAWLSPTRLDDFREGFIYGTGGGSAVAGILLALLHWYRHRYRDE